MATIFITGISGFIGKELARQMKLAGHMVTGSSFTGIGDSNTKCDIRKPDEVLNLILSAQPDVIIHAAALSSVTIGRTMDYYESNVLGTENVIAALNSLGGRRRIVFISTAGVYGNQKVQVLTEDLNPLPVSHYGMSKLVCERMLANEKDAHDITIVRPFNIVGIGQNSSFIVPKLVEHFAERKATVKLGNLNPVRDYLDLRTCCSLIMKLALTPESFGETVNLCAGTGTSVQDLLNILTDLTQHAIEVIPDLEFTRKSEVWRLLGSAVKLESILSQPVTSRPFKDVLSEMLVYDVFKREAAICK